MQDIIRLLPDTLANQIAAGEVVQRPASVVKELLENSIDAGAKEIKLIVKDAGKTLIQVIDDGGGMSETDARMSFERHATSKIKSTEDLFSIRTFGFRGEALASIAAVSQVEMKTRREEDELAVHLQIEGSVIKEINPVNYTTGTSIAVKNLFFNVPARRNFLKSNPVEMKHIVDEFQRTALAYPGIAFHLDQNDLEMYQLTPGKLSQRIVGIFGSHYKQNLVTCQEETGDISITGYIGRPESAKKTRGEQFFFVNNRYIKSNYLNHAVVDAYEGLLMSDTYPFYTLFFEIDPKRIDINVHPTKTEIKFDDERSIYAITRSTVKKALGVHNITPSLDFERDINLDRNFFPKTSPQTAYHEPRETARDRANKENWEKLFNSFESTTQKIESESEEPQPSIRFESALNKRSSEPASEKQNQERKALIQVLGKYIITQLRSSIILIDQNKAHERILYEKYVRRLSTKSGSSQQCLFPQNIELNNADMELVMELADEIKDLGFDFEPFSKSSIVVQGIPSDLNTGNEKEVFEGLIEQIKHQKSNLNVGSTELLSRSFAKRAAISYNQALDITEMRAIIDQLFACENPNYTPEGEMTYVVIDENMLDQYFKR